MADKEEKGQRSGNVSLESKPAEITITKASEDVRIMAFGEGFIDLSTCEEIQQVFKANNKEGLHWLFDLNHLSFVDSEGIKVVLRCIREVMNGNCYGAIVCNDSSKSYKVLNLLGITNSPEIFHSDIQHGLQYLR